MSFARQVVDHLDDCGPADGARLGTTLVDLLAAAVAARLDRDGELPPGTVAQARLRRVRELIEQRLADPTLSPRMIADAHHVSLRYLYKLFEVEQRGVTGWIRRPRLERCRRDLLDPALATLPVRAGAPSCTDRQRLCTRRQRRRVPPRPDRDS